MTGLIPDRLRLVAEAICDKLESALPAQDFGRQLSLWEESLALAKVAIDALDAAPQPALTPAADEREALIEVMKTAVNNNPADGKPYSHIADALLAKGYREAAWQPIQTAPRDETAVLICGGASTSDEYGP